VLRDPRPGDVRDSRASIELAGELLGYEPIVSLEEGLDQTCDWYRQSTGAGSLP
jgi:nucleoside-diphosphate-sugar epimerase